MPSENNIRYRESHVEIKNRAYMMHHVIYITIKSPLEQLFLVKAGKTSAKKQLRHVPQAQCQSPGLDCISVSCKERSRPPPHINT